MTIPHISFGQTISSSEWGNAVADAINPTAWANVGSYDTNFAAFGSFRYRRVNDVVMLVGDFVWSGGASGDDEYTVATLPAGFRPAGIVTVVAWQHSTGLARRVRIDTAGGINITDSLATSRVWGLTAQFPTT